MSKRHPSDLREEAISIVLAAKRFDEWLAREGNLDALKAVILTYADGDAEQLFGQLREDFWSNL